MFSPLYNPLQKEEGKKERKEGIKKQKRRRRGGNSLDSFLTSDGLESIHETSILEDSMDRLFSKSSTNDFMRISQTDCDEFRSSCHQEEVDHVILLSWRIRLLFSAMGSLEGWKGIIKECGGSYGNSFQFLVGNPLDRSFEAADVGRRQSFEESFNSFFFPNRFNHF
jgi:hypothetical protein